MPVPSLPTLTVAKTPDKAAAALVVGYGGDGVVGAPSALDKEYGKRLGLGIDALAASVGAKAEAGHTRTLPAVGGWPVVVVVGLGDTAPSPEDLRQAAGSGVRQAAKQGDGGIQRGGVPGCRRAGDRAGRGRGSRCWAATATGRSAAATDTPPAVAAITVVTPLAGRRAVTSESGDQRGDGRPVGDRRPGVGEHPAEPALPRLVRRGGQDLPQGLRVSVEVLDDKALGQGRLRRHPGRRRRLVPAAAAGPAGVRAARAPSTTSRWSARASPSTPAV